MNHLQYDQADILIVDDDPQVLDLLENTLCEAGFAAYRADDSESALKMVQHISPDLIICDINLNGESGLDLCQEIKQLPNRSDVPVMFLSGAQIPDIIRRSHAAGGIYYLRKPFDPSVLLELIDKAIWLPHLVSARLSV